MALQHAKVSRALVGHGPSPRFFPFEAVAIGMSAESVNSRTLQTPVLMECRIPSQ